MRFEQLDYLATVIRLGSLRRAASELHVSQPALSETLRNLERELGVTLLERRSSGAALSEEGRELLPHVMDVLESVDRLTRAADQQRRSNRAVRLGTVGAATVPVLAPAIQAFGFMNPKTPVTVIPAQPAEINRALREGAMDLGLVNLLAGDDIAPDLEATLLLRGRVVACLPPDSPLAARQALHPADLLTEPLIVMRAGYLMHRFTQRLFAGNFPDYSYTMDGAEMGKLMVAEGLGITLLPDYSVIGDPLERHGLITARPLAASEADVFLYLHRRSAASMPRSVQALHEALVKRSAQYSQEARQAGGTDEQAPRPAAPAQPVTQPGDRAAPAGSAGAAPPCR